MKKLRSESTYFRRRIETRPNPDPRLHEIFRVGGLRLSFIRNEEMGYHNRHIAVHKLPHKNKGKNQEPGLGLAVLTYAEIESKVQSVC